MAALKKTKGMDLTKGPILKTLIAFAVPIFISSLIQQLYTTADEVVVGKFAGDVALAAVGSTGNVTKLIVNLVSGLSVGATVTCAKYFGAKNAEGIKRTVHTAISVALLGGALIALAGIILTKPLLNMVDTPAEVFGEAAAYMAIIFAGTPFSFVYNFGAGLLRASGDTKRPLYFLTMSGILNVLLNLLFVIVFKMSAAGVGLATVLSQLFSALAIIIYMSKRDDDMKLYLKKLRIYGAEFSNIVRIGLPAGLNNILYNIANITLQANINDFGKEYMAASALGTTITHYISIGQTAISSSAISFVGQNYGAKNFKRIKKTALISMAVSASYSLFAICLIALFPEFILGLFTNSASVIQKGIYKTLIVSSGYLLNVPASVLGSSLRGMERSKTPMLVNVLSICISRISWVWFVFPLNPVFEMLFFCYPISWFLSSSIMSLMFLKAIKGFQKEEKTQA